MGFGLYGFWSSNSKSSDGHQWDDFWLQNRIFPVLNSLVFPSLTSFWTPGLPVTGPTRRSAVRESQLEAINRLNEPGGSD